MNPVAASRVRAFFVCVAATTTVAVAQRLPSLGSPLQAPSQGLQGTFTGIARESAPDGQGLEYPVQFVFSGSDAALRLQVTGSAKVPAGANQSVTIEIAVDYTGTAKGAEVTMRSERIVARVVETGEQLPQQPQQLTATLRGDMLAGRAGSDEEGWATFEVKRTTRADDGRRVLAATEPDGEWRGQGREPGPSGAELVYPVVWRAKPQGGQWVVELSADIQYPTEDGGKVPTEYRARFAVTMRDGELRGRSEHSEVHIPSQQRSVPVPGQELRARLDGEVLRARVGNDQEGWSQLEMRRANAPSAEPATPTRDDPRAGVELGKGRTDSPPVPAAYGTVRLERRDIDDAATGIVSHTLRLPAGWQFQGGPEWRAEPDSFVNLVGAVRGTGAEEVRFLAGHVFQYSRTRSSFGDQGGPQEAWTSAGKASRRAPDRPGQVAVELLIPFLRPNATDVQLVDAAQLPEQEKAVRELQKPQLDHLEAMCQNARTQGQVGVDSNLWLACERSRVRYREAGQEWEEEIRCSLLGMHGRVHSEDIATENGFWQVTGVHTFRAPAGQLDARLPLLVMIAGSVRSTPRWQAAVDEVKLELMKQLTQQLRQQTADMARELGQRTRQRAAELAQLSDDQMRSWRSQQDSLDRMHKANVQALGEVHDFRDSDGHTRTVTNHYDRAFRDPNDNLILTNDPNYRPDGDPAVNRVRWEEMQRIDPLRNR